ncbi:sensor domain-containing diguanylate cyclase [Martelella sp. AD-3]|uniref:sensor domain-containing diguanylate cyclase n=1 Tax=Martelella sp. AD-3 TaxID=686597 RepID=UPI000467BC2B|nr:sensor domain-containing diguanylate cyclase [Martelella sp. AD-3]AMM83752.1 diguanylate cyclase [Martelella sp. AD-3]MAM13008.1 sensor domain-containing diguanylate cyclase [Rhizobiaceae bacterium]|tara:strand:+ start:513 stop:1421 length:909 start_codon:yes stop_codon:yes gene_type:complete
MEGKLRRILRFMELTDVFFAVFDEEDRLLFANRKYRETFFLEEEEHPYWPDLMRRNFHARRGTVISSPDFELWLKGTLSRRGKVPFRAFETDVHDGTWLWMTETVDEDGWMLCLASDITPLRAQGRTLRQERDIALRSSLTDDLTGIANRRFLMERLVDMIEREAETTGSPPGCFAILDVDNFKQVNDRFGHAYGDRLLVGFAQKISTLVRRIDCFGRLGGEEFGLVLPRMTPPEAAGAVETMLEAVSALRPFSEHPDFSYSFSAGIAPATCREDQADLYARADAALYKAKRAGKNRVCLSD